MGRRNSLCEEILVPTYKHKLKWTLLMKHEKWKENQMSKNAILLYLGMICSNGKLLQQMPEETPQALCAAWNFINEYKLEDEIK